MQDILRYEMIYLPFCLSFLNIFILSFYLLVEDNIKKYILVKFLVVYCLGIVFAFSLNIMWISGTTLLLIVLGLSVKSLFRDLLFVSIMFFMPIFLGAAIIYGTVWYVILFSIIISVCLAHIVTVWFILIKSKYQ